MSEVAGAIGRKVVADLGGRLVKVHLVGPGFGQDVGEEDPPLPRGEKPTGVPRSQETCPPSRTLQ